MSELDSKERKSGIILSYVSIITSTIIQLLYTPFLIKMMGQSEYGLYTLISSIIGYLAILDLGFGNAIIVYTSKYRVQGRSEEEQKLHGMFYRVFCVIGAVSFLLGLILYFNVENIFGKTMNDTEVEKAKVMMLILALNLAVTFSFSIYSSIISAYEKFVFQKVMSIASTILKPVLMIPLLFMGYKSIAMAIVITLVNFIIIFTNYFYCRNRLNVKIKYRGFSKDLFKIIFNYSFFIFLGVIVDKVNWSADQIILGSVSGTIAVSVYSVASQLNTLFISLSTAVSGIMLPKMSKMVEKNSTPQELTYEFIKVGRIQYYIIFLMASGLVLFGKEFIIAWVGEEFIESYYVALLLILPVCVPLIQNLGLSIMQAMNKYKFKTISTAIMSIFNILISVVLATKYGAIGAALGTSIALVVCNIILINIYYYRKIKLDVIMFWKSIIKMTVLFLMPVVIVTVLMNLIVIYGVPKLLVFGSIYVLLYCVICYLFVMNEYERKIITSLIEKLHVKV